MKKKKPVNWPFHHGDTSGVVGVHSHGMADWVMDEMELGARVAIFLDSENNAAEVHFMGWGPFPPFYRWEFDGPE